MNHPNCWTTFKSIQAIQEEHRQAQTELLLDWLYTISSITLGILAGSIIGVLAA